ncbi:type II/IV secretion system protein [Candidatus Falkowbacteria bacterium]|nr:type II/IV secretion system protein [Candidatus Falkowbacteria bacterium]
MLKETNKKLLNFILNKGGIKEKDVAEVDNLLKKDNAKELREVLTKGGFIDVEKLAEFEASFFNYPYVNLMARKIDEAAQKLLPMSLAEQHFAICFSAAGEKLSIALAKPDDYDTREAIDFWASSKGYVPEYHVCSFLAWQEVVKKYGAFSAEVATAVGQVKEERAQKVKEGEISTENIEEVIKRAPVAQIVSVIVKHAIESRASDIHIEPFEKSSRVRFRVDGVLQTVLTLPFYVHDSVITRIKVMSNLKIDETRIPQDGRFKYETAEQRYDLRVSIMPLSGREKATLRILDISGKALTLEQLGFSEEMRKTVDKAVDAPYGMILVTGPTGSGKSTTLFSILSKLNDDGVNITTLEDPIEYNIPGINQAQIRPEVKFTFASGLRALMRQDPDVIMVGEIRDSETAEMAVHAALTGHRLFSTLHTNDALGAIPRLVDMKVEPFLLASVLTLIIAQRLSRRICPKCKESYELPEDIMKKVKEILSGVASNVLPPEINLSQKLIGWRGKGCPLCKNSGYSGRVVVAETLLISERMREIIANGFRHEEVKKEMENRPMLTLLQDGVIKALQGITTLEEVMRVSKEEKEQE